MNRNDFERALSLTNHIEAFTPGVYVLHQAGFTDDDIAWFYNVEVRKVLEARNALPDPYPALFFDENEEQLIARINARPLPDL